MHDHRIIHLLQRAAADPGGAVKQAGIFVACLAVAAVFVSPFLWLVRSSLVDAGQMFEFPPQWIPHPIAWTNYLDALTAVPFGRYLLNALFILVPTVVGTVTSTTLAAYAFARLEWPGRDVLFGLLMLTFMLPFVATLIPTFLLWTRLRPVNTDWPLVLPHWFGSDVFFIFLLRQFLPHDSPRTGRSGDPRWREPAAGSLARDRAAQSSCSRDCGHFLGPCRME
jgi:multiple sugar transport system permease protein